jgi:predicted phage terminase large subunit-like protein
MTKDEITLLRNDFLSFASKALFELDGTIVSEDGYLAYLSAILTKFANGKTKRLIINAPPRHLKSLLATVCLIAWVLAHNAKEKIILLAGSMSLAETHARAIRAIMRAEWYRATFPTRIKKGHGSATHFVTTAGGEVFAASIHSNITGRGGHVIVIDDPHDTDDADKPQPLGDVIERFNKNVKSRLNSQLTGGIVVVAHRVGDGDLTSHLLTRGGWEHVVLPLVAPRNQTFKANGVVWRRYKGELLRADFADEKDIAELKETQFNYDWLYQQDCDGQALPSIKAKHFPTAARETYADLPRVLSIDPGSSDVKHASFSVAQVWAFNRENLYLIDDYRAQCKFNDLKMKVRGLIRQYRPWVVLIENTANGPALVSELTQALKNRCQIVPITPHGSKSSRLSRHIDKIIQGRVHLAGHRDYWAEVIEEFGAFPHGKHSDQIDSFTQMADYVEAHGALAKPSSMMAEFPMVMASNSQAFGYAPRPMSAAELKKPGIYAGRGNSNYAPNGPFIEAKAWVVK